MRVHIRDYKRQGQAGRDKFSDGGDEGGYQRSRKEKGRKEVGRSISKRERVICYIIPSFQFLNKDGLSQNRY